jgi:Fe-S cluster biogenesis protein NfuA
MMKARIKIEALTLPEGEAMEEKVKQVLDKVRPYLERDGGNVELIEVIDSTGTVKLKLVGACAGCPMSKMTLKNGIERILKQEVPEVKEVVAV